jgi:hypothetical protein
MEHVMARMPRVPSWKDEKPMDKAKAFYEPISAGYHPGWKCADLESRLDGKFVPKISDALANKTLIHHPVRPKIEGTYPIMQAMKDAKRARETEPVLSAHCLPVTFPIKADKVRYPASTKRGADNPLYFVSSQVIGKEPPQQHQLAERYFPKNCDYTKTYTDSKPRITGLVTRPTMSRVHRELDQPY